MKKRYMIPQTLVCIFNESSPILAGLSNTNIIKDDKDGYDDLSKDSSMWEYMDNED